MLDEKQLNLLTAKCRLPSKCLKQKLKISSEFLIAIGIAEINEESLNWCFCAVLSRSFSGSPDSGVQNVAKLTVFWKSKSTFLPISVSVQQSTSSITQKKAIASIAGMIKRRFFKFSREEKFWLEKNFSSIMERRNQHMKFTTFTASFILQTRFKLNSSFKRFEKIFSISEKSIFARHSKSKTAFSELSILDLKWFSRWKNWNRLIIL